MRLSKKQIRQGIQHDERFVRSQALTYFTDSYARDPANIHAVIAAIERYGADAAFETLQHLSHLGQDEESVRWMLEALKSSSGDGDQFSLRLHYSQALVEADLDLLTPHLEQLETALDDPEAKIALRERLEFRDLRTKECWQKLEAFAERERNTEFVSDADLPHGYRLVEAIARNRRAAGRVLDLLDADVDDSNGNPMTWLEGFAVRIAAEMRLTKALPKLLNKLRIDAEWLNEECVYGFVRIGGDEVVRQLAQAYEQEEWHFRLSAAFCFEAIHSDRVVEACRELIDLGDDLKVDLMSAMLCQYSDEAIDLARNVLTTYTSGEEVLRCRQILIAVATLMEVDFPELESWREDERTGQAAIETPAPEFEVIDEYDKLLTVAAPQAPTQTVAKPRSTALPKRSAMFQNRGVSRNDPCPCGSGKKYKKCCMRR